MVRKDKNSLLAEANRINYRLRSTFFYRKLIEYKTLGLSPTVKKLIPVSDNYDWSNYTKWGISKTSFEIIKKSKLPIVEVFCHPKILREHPKLIGYYRNIAVLSQKSVGYLVAIQTNNYENEKIKEISEKTALALSKLFNEHISLIIDNALQGFEENHIQGLLFASTGAQIDGSWRNAIGKEAEKIVQKILIQQAIRQKSITTFLLRSGTGLEKYNRLETKKQLSRADEFRGFSLNNKKSVLFSSEPNVSILDKDGSTITVIEVKGGADPAGALERYGASKKSFEEARRQNKQVITIFVASCITEEVEKRVKSDKIINHYFNLTNILTNEKIKKQFLKTVFKEI
jgi:hypothetical protein